MLIYKIAFNHENSHFGDNGETKTIVLTMSNFLKFYYSCGDSWLSQVVEVGTGEKRKKEGAELVTECMRACVHSCMQEREKARTGRER